MNKKCIIDLHYLPSIEYFCALKTFNEVIFEKHEHFVKQSFRNRCYINTAHGKAMLSVPLTEKHGNVLIKDIRIDYAQKWQNNQWRTIESAYSNAPYFEHYAGEIHKAIYKSYSFLFDLNLDLLSFCLQSLKWNLSRSESVSWENGSLEETIDLRSAISAKKHHSSRSFYSHVPYYQVFGNQFVENLSLIDLLFCEGPRSPLLINQSRAEN